MRDWNEALEAHRHCRSFHTEGWAAERAVGFTCSCGGHEQTWSLPLTDFAHQLDEYREMFLGMRRIELGLNNRGESTAKRITKQADQRAKALLHRHLTKEQRADLRASRGFNLVGQNGKTYRVEEGSCRNVFLMIAGEKRVLYCVVPAAERIPVYDLMLAQKVMLESDIKHFFKIAAQEIVPRKTKAELRRQRRARRRTSDDAWGDVPITAEDAHNPQRWADERLALARQARGETR